MKDINILFSFFLIFNRALFSECIATYSIDLSSEFIKIAIVKPGVPMEIALNGESQRKTAAVVFIKGDERLFGDAAMNMGVKYPKNLYHSITTLIGKTITHPVVVEFMKNFPYYDLLMDDNNQLSFRDGDAVYTTEELLAMIFENSKNIAETYSEMPMKGGVVVVPPYFTQDERRAVIRAAELAGIVVPQLMNSNTAVALNYGIFRRKTFNYTVQYYMFYDVGSSATVATIIGYQVLKNKEYGMMVENPQLSIIGIGYDQTLGGTQFTLRLQKHLATEFNKAKKSKKDVTSVPRSMAKFYKEAARVLKVLSANNEIYAQIENVLDDQDFKLKITRAQFEEMCKDLFARFSEPIHKALESAQIPMPTINEIILMGGGTRIPKIQEILLKTSDRQELGKGINTDEAAALGAVYQAAFISPGFKVQNFVVKDCNIVPISVDFLRFKIVDDIETAHPTSRMIFDVMNPFPQKKVLTFNRHFKNFDFNVSYGSNDKDKKIIFHVSVENMTNVYNEYMKSTDLYVTEFKGVKAHFAMDNSGLFSLKYIEATFERKQDKDNIKETSTFEKLGNTISNFFGSSAEEKVDKVTNDDKKEDVVKNITEQSVNETIANKTAINGTEIKSNETNVPKPKVEVIHQNLHFISTWKSFDIPSEKVIEKSKQKIRMLKEIDDRKIALEKSKNELESYIFEIKSIFEKDVYMKCSTESERSKVLEEAGIASDWYEEQDKETTTEAYTAKHKSLVKLMNDINYRVSEFSGRSEVIGKLNSILNTSNIFLQNLYNVSGEGPGMILTKLEYESLSRLINETTKWFVSTNATFQSMKLYENPTVTISDFEPHIRSLEREIGYLLNKISIWRNQTPPPSTTDESKGKTESDSPKKNEQETKESLKDDLPKTEESLPPLPEKVKEHRDDL